MRSFFGISTCVAATLICITASEWLEPRNNTWNSSFTLTDDQIKSLGLSNEAAHNLEVVVRFEQTNWATGSVINDPFYTDLPANATTAPAGSLLKLEAFTNTSTYTIAPSLALSRFIYQSKTLNGTVVPVSAYILWPYHTLGGIKAAPLVGWGHGTAGLVAECAPSHMRNLLYQFSGPYALALAGYAVVATDYAGLGVPFYPDGSPILHQYVASPAGGNDILYAVQAARSAFADNLTEEFVVYGHSQGGGTAWAAAQQQVELQIPGYLGTIAGSPVTNTTMLVKATGQSLAMMQATNTMKSIWPDVDIGAEMLTTRGQALLTLVEEVQGCSLAVETALAGTLEADPTAALMKDGFIDSYWSTSFANLTAVGGQDFVGPMLVFHGTNDALLPEALTALSVNQTCASFPERELRYVVAQGVGHVDASYATQQIWLKWLEERFNSKSKSGMYATRSETRSGTTSCTVETIGDDTARPLDQYQSALNWHLSYSPNGIL
ncbi:unnamed protein product [Clonostachys rosea f. rosea IK726]|jgi:pimeloyl-ACP methyl ester carboxylesterase|uniref:Uncharacterized protein n=1 Tax=Clonostachys rosea f. rosea IK726 TaxID=1349383 RepID=A0ACA9TJ22_BIOOC|nr:unnamed protein product [Clonostachys rosea f. rosea IK726]